MGVGDGVGESKGEEAGVGEREGVGTGAGRIDGVGESVGDGGGEGVGFGKEVWSLKFEERENAFLSKGNGGGRGGRVKLV